VITCGAPVSPIDDGDVRAFAHDGVLCTDSPRSTVARTIPAPSSKTSAGGPSFAEIERLASRSRLPEIVATLMSTREVRFYHDQVPVKETGTRQRTPWHQDQP
jgi:hypothetical protein